MTILLTGANGFLGAAVLQSLEKARLKVAVHVRNATPQLQRAFTEISAGEMTRATDFLEPNTKRNNIWVSSS